MSNLPKGATILSQDERPIKAIYWPIEDDAGYVVDRGGITSIEAYDECGGMSMVPWLAVFRGDEIVVRSPADHVSVHYT